MSPYPPPPPPLYRSPTGLLLLLKRSKDLPRGEISCCSPHFLVRYFPTNRAGASNPGDDSISYGTGEPGNARFIVAVRKGSAVTSMSPAASPRPRNPGPLLAGQPASLLLAWTCELGVPVYADSSGGSLPYTPRPQCTRSAAVALKDHASVRPPVL
jgi:hypothetical protein